MNPFARNTSCSHLKVLIHLFSTLLLFSSFDRVATSVLKDMLKEHRSRISSNLDLTFTPLEHSSNNYGSADYTDYDYQADSLENTTSQGSSEDSAPDYDAMDLSKSEPLVKNLTTTSPEDLQQMHEYARLNFIKTFKEKMLSKLRLLAPPNMTDISRHRYPSHAIEAMEQSPQLGVQQDEPAQESPDTYHAKIKTTLRFAEQLPTGRLHPKKVASLSSKSLYFKLPRDIDETNVERSTLFVYPSWPKSANFTHLKLVIRSNYRPNKPIEQRKLLYSSTTTSVHWQRIDITELAQEWVESDDELNLGITIELLDEDDKLVHQEAPSHSETDKSERISFIKLQLNDKEPKRRRKRSTDDMNRVCELDDQEARCCRYRFVLDFDELGPDFDFVISPRRFTANYCSGKCPSYYLPASPNSHLTASLTRGKQSRCCTATELKPINMVYVNNEGNINSGDLPGMSIARCGCE